MNSESIEKLKEALLDYYRTELELCKIKDRINQIIDESDIPYGNSIINLQGDTFLLKTQSRFGGCSKQFKSLKYIPVIKPGQD
jgi:CMP-2-keto-3-deoxyoctulosonic acid synthetase